jgi:DNA (cytosine-5)-methyltransferase 1
VKVGSIFSGIGGMDKGLTDAGMEIIWHVETDKWSQCVLSHRFPDGRVYGDVREYREYEWVDLISFGFPCTNLSVAGKRAGLGGDESRLFWAAMAIVRRLKPTWLLIENVPGLLSSNQGRDFGIVLGALAHCGYWWSYRVLDSQYFGVAQRRRRVFIVGHLGSPCPAEILFESQGVSGDSAPVHEEGQGVSGTLTQSLGHNGHSSPRGDGGDNLVVGSLQGGGNRGWRISAEQAAEHIIPEIAYTLRSNPSHSGDKGDGGINTTLIPTVSHLLLAKGNSSVDDSLETYVIQDARDIRNKAQHGIGIHNDGPMFTLDGTSQHAVGTYRKRTMAHRADSHDERWEESERADGLTVDQRPTTLIGAPTDPAGVREAPRTSGRLDLSLRCRCPDGPRYRGLGNAVTAPVVEWIGRRILIAHNR